MEWQSRLVAVLFFIINMSITATSTRLPVFEPIYTYNKAWVDSVSGNDSIGELQREDKPYSTILAAFTAAQIATGNWIVTVMPGDYTDTGLVPSGSNYNIATYWHGGTKWVATSSASLYDLTGVTADKRLWILGHGRFYGSNISGRTGKFINSTYGTTRIASFIIEADRIEAGNQGPIFDLRGTFDTFDAQYTGSAPSRNEINVGTFDNRQGFAYLRLAWDNGAQPVFVHCNYIGGINLDGGWLVVDTGYAEAFVIGTNGFDSGESLDLRCLYRFKATAQPALLIRCGAARITSPNYEVTDGAAPIIKIASNAAAGTRVSLYGGGRIKEWAGGSSPAILFDAVNADYKVRLIGDYEIIMANSATNSIATTGSNAQTMEIFGSLTTNLVLDSDVTVRGAIPTVDAAIWTDF